MSAVWDLPFVPVQTLGAAAVAAAVLWQFLPGSWSTAKVVSATIAGAVLVSALLVLAGMVPAWGTIRLTAYAGMLSLSVVTAWLLSYRLVAPLGVDAFRLRQLFAVALVLGVVGARMRYVYERWDRFSLDDHGHAVTWTQALGKAADLDTGGAVWYGGLLLGGAGMVLMLRHFRVPVLAFGDALVPGLMAAIGVGRIGCFFNGCCYGAPTDLPWAVTSPVYPFGPIHPAPLYETLATWSMAAILLWWYPRRQGHGQLVFLAVVGYGVWRFFNETLRGGHDAFTTMFGHQVTTSQATSVHLVLLAIITALVIRWRRRVQVASGRPEVVPEGAASLRQPDPS